MGGCGQSDLSLDSGSFQRERPPATTRPVVAALFGEVARFHAAMEPTEVNANRFAQLAGELMSLEDVG